MQEGGGDAPNADIRRYGGEMWVNVFNIVREVGGNVGGGSGTF